MQFLKNKFSDSNNYINSFLEVGNTLKNLEKNDTITEKMKRDFTKNFVEKLVSTGLIDQSTIDMFDDQNPWSIDFPSWHGNFVEDRGKKVFVIGSEPHIYHRYLQTVYGLNNEKTCDHFFEESHSIFTFLSELLSTRLNMPKSLILDELYLTDLFPLSPCKGHGKSVGSPKAIQKLIGKGASWSSIRRNYAAYNLPSEIEGVKPSLILTQGKAVFTEVVKILAITDRSKKIAVKTASGRNQYVRITTWNKIPIISVPHIGSKRMATFWKNNINEVKAVLSAN
jgi:hypothetical protein